MSYTFSGLACGTIGLTGCDLQQAVQHKDIVTCKPPACLLTLEHELCTPLLCANNLCIQLRRPHPLPASSWNWVCGADLLDM